MMKNTRALILTNFIGFLLLFSLNGSAQDTPKADNSIHDRMYSLVQKSDQVILPKEVTERIDLINKDKPNKAKLVFAQTSMLKVLYNNALSKDDIRFFGNELLKNKSASYIAISSDIKKVLNKL